MFNFILRRKKICCVFLCFVFLSALFLFSKIRFKQDFSQVLPDSLSQEFKLFESSPLSNKVFVVVYCDDAALSFSAAQKAFDLLSLDKELGFKSSKTDKDFLLSYYYYFASLWDLSFADKIESLLNKNEIDKRLKENITALFSVEGAFNQDFIIADPLNLILLFAQKLEILNFSPDLKIENGFIVSKDLKKVLLIFDYPKNSLDLTNAKKIKDKIDIIKKQLPQNVNIFYMGAPRYTSENNETITADIYRILIISFVLTALLFLFFLRDKKALLIYLLPPIAVIFAADFASIIFKGISAITIGFASVLIGLSIDYCIYMYFALKSCRQEDRFLCAKKMFKPILISAGTSIAAFFVLLFSGIEIFRQISVFCISGLLFAVFVSLFILPFIFDCKSEYANRFNFKFKMNKLTACILLLAIFIVSFIGVMKAKINASPEILNTVSKQFDLDRSIFEEITGGAYANNKLFLVFGDTIEETLINNEIVSAQNPKHLHLSGLYPSKKQAEKNIDLWKQFWKPKMPLIENSINAISKQYAIESSIFNRFYDYLQDGKSADDFSLTVLFNPIMQVGQEYAFVNIVPQDIKIKSDRRIKTFSISNEDLKNKIVKDVHSRFVKIMPALLLCCLIVLSAAFKNIKCALLAVLPAICAIGVFFALASLLAIEINIFGLLALPLLIGLSIDYGIFIIFQNAHGEKLHPTKALFIAALSTLIGFGSLIAAHHKVLFIIGFMVFSGILTAMLVSVFIIPPFFKNEGKH